MNNIYIGNRYVPVFANPVEWDNLREYEPLTIVTYQGTAYTSRQTVPVGTALSNTDYWVVTGNYNAQVEQYRQETADLANDVSELSDDVNAVETSVTNLSANKVDKVKNRKFLFVGDSYIASHTNTCVELACSILGITNYSNLSVSGTSFHDGSFLSQISNYTGDKTQITDIFVIGGLNDSIYDTNNATLTNAITAFFTYTKANYPNATVSVCFAGHAFDNASLLDGRTWNKRTWALFMYENTVLKNGGIMHPDMWQALAISTYHMGSDGIHPSSDGQNELANVLVSYITNTPVQSTYPYFGLGSSNFFYSVLGDNVEVNYDGSFLQIDSVGGQTIAGNSTVTIASNLRLYFNKPVIIPCLPRAVYCNNLSHQELRGWLVFSGNTLSLKLNCLTNSGYNSLVFSSNGNISIDALQITAPTLNLM